MIENIKTMQDNMFSNLGEDVVQDNNQPIDNKPIVDIPITKQDLDSEENKVMLKRMQDWLLNEQQIQFDNRQQMAIDRDYYDSIQWTEEEIAALSDRGQNPSTHNIIKPSVDWIRGSERRSKFDFVVLPRTKDHSKSAEVKTKLIKYVFDANYAQYLRSKAFDDSIISGVGWLEEGVRNTETDEPLFIRYESWHNIYYDSLSIRPDMADAKYIFRLKYIDLEDAIQLYPEREAQLRAENSSLSTTKAGNHLLESEYLENQIEYNNSINALTTTQTIQRDRIQIVECQYRKYLNTKIMKTTGKQMKAYHNKIYNENNKLHNDLVKHNIVTLSDIKTNVVYIAHFCGDTLLYHNMSDYHHNRFTFTPLWCYRRGRDNAPYGIIRSVRDAQDDYNKRASKALYLISDNRVIADKGAVDDVEEAREQASRPDGWVELNPNKRFEFKNDKDLAMAQMAMQERAKQIVQDIMAVSNEQLGRDTNLVSSVAIREKMQQGTVASSPLFDNYYLGAQIHGEKVLSLIEQYYDEEKIVRVTSDTGKIEYAVVNSSDDSEGYIYNSQDDFVLSRQDFRDTTRQMFQQQMFDFLTKISSVDPRSAMSLLDLAVDIADVPQREKIISRIRQVSGVQDIDTDTPEGQQAAAAMQQKAQQDAELQTKMQELEMRIKTSEAELKMSKATQAKADATLKAVTSLYSAIQAAGVIKDNPVISNMADEIALSAGFQDMNRSPLIPMPSGMPQTSDVGANNNIDNNTSPMFPNRPNNVNLGNNMMGINNAMSPQPPDINMKKGIETTQIGDMQK